MPAVPQQTDRRAYPAWHENEPTRSAPEERTSPASTEPEAKVWEKQAAYLRVLLKLMRQANNRAANYSRKWEKLNDELNDLMDRQGVTDIRERANVKEANLTLIGHDAAWSHWEREAKRYQGTIMAEEAAARMLSALDNE